MTNPKPGSKMLVPLPTTTPINAPTKPQSQAPDAADVSNKRKFDRINPPRKNSANFLLLQFINNRVGEIGGFRRAAQIFGNRLTFGKNFEHRAFDIFRRLALADVFEH